MYCLSVGNKASVFRLLRVYIYVSVKCTLLPYKVVHSCGAKVYNLVR